MPTALSSYLSRRFRSAGTRRKRLKRSDNLKRGHFTLDPDHETKAALVMSTASTSSKWYRSRRPRNPSEVANFGSSSTLYHSSPNLRSSPFPARTPISNHVHAYRRGNALRHMVVTSLRLPRWRKKGTLGPRQGSACTTHPSKKKSTSLAASLSHSRPSHNSHLGKATLIGYPQACGGQMLQKLPCSLCSSPGGCSCTSIDLDQKDGSLTNNDMLAAQLVWAIPRIVVSHPTPSAFEPPRTDKNNKDTRKPSRRALAPPRIYPSRNDMPPSPWQIYNLRGSPAENVVSGRTSDQFIPSHSRSRTTNQAHSLASVYSSDLNHNRTTFSSCRNSWLSTTSLMSKGESIRKEASTEGFSDGDQAAAIALENFFRGGGRGASTYSPYRRSSVDLLLTSVKVGREPLSQVSPQRVSPRENADVSISMCNTGTLTEASHFQYDLDHKEEAGSVDRDRESLHDEKVKVEEDEDLDSDFGGGGGGDDDDEEEGIVEEYHCATEEILREYGVEI